MDPLDLLEKLPNNEIYSDNDRYHDFRQLFMGTDQGKRVLKEILSWGKLFKPSISGSPVDPYAMAIRDGEKNMALRLMVTVNNEPKHKPNTQINKVKS